jgi:hypothetical protein
MWDERGAAMLGAKKPIPKGLLSKAHEPPWGMRMKDPFTGVEHGVTARAGVSEASKANPARALRTGIDASAAEFETFKEAVFVRGEIGIQSAGHANAPGVDFVTAARRADGQMEIILNDATVNANKKPKTIPPVKWVDEAEAAINRMDLGDTALEEEIREAMEAKRFRVRTLTVTTSPTGMTVVGW